MSMKQWMASLQEARKRKENLKISLSGHDKRIAEQKQIIKRAHLTIKTHRVMKKQVKNQFKVTENELELKKTERLAKSLA